MRLGWLLIETLVFLAAIVVGLAAASQALGRGVWFDEFWTLALISPGSSALDILRQLRGDAHPYLYFGLVWLGQVLGLDTIWSLRALNLLTPLLIAAPLVVGVRGGDIAWRTAALLLVAAISSPVFLYYAAELRPYAMTFGAAIGLSTAWYICLRRILGGLALGGGLLALWTLTLGALANLQYFGCLMGGIFTGLLLLALIARRRWREALVVAGFSLLAAAPAVALAWVQAQGAIGGDMGWITTTPKQAVWLTIGLVMRAGLDNTALLLLAAIAMIGLLRATDARRDAVPALGLMAAGGLFLALLMVANFLKPLIIDRYLIAAAGVLLTGAVLLAGGASSRALSPRLTRVLIVLACLVAIAGAARSLIYRAEDREGWRTSALALKAANARCAGTRIYTAAHYVGRPVSPAYARLYLQTKRYGHRYYLEQVGLAATELPSDRRVAPRHGCPAIVWLEHAHIRPPAEAFAEDLARTNGSATDLVFVGSGALVFVR